MPTITRVATAPYTIPLKAALTWGSGHALARLEHTLVRVDLSDGAYGIAEATPRPSIYGETRASIEAIIADYLAPKLLGKSVDDYERIAAISERMAHIKNNHTAKGALDMALHQALAFSRGQSLAGYLGCSRQRIALSAIVGTGSPEAVLADVAALHLAGLRVFKVKIGQDIASEIHTIQQLIASTLAARFYVDANETLASADAANILDRLYAMGVMYCEEALPVHRLRERRQLRRDCRMPIIADDSAFTLAELERELAHETFDTLNIKTARTGYSQSLRMLEKASGAGKSLMIGSQASSLLGCLHAAVLAGRREVNCPSECSFYVKTEADLSFAPPIVDGCWELAAVERALRRTQADLAKERI